MLVPDLFNYILPVIFLVPHVRWNKKGMALSLENIENLIKASWNKLHNSSKELTTRLIKPSNEIAGFETAELHSYLIKKYTKEEELMGHYYNLLSKRKRTIQKEISLNIQNEPPLTLTTLKTELFTEFKNANISPYVCLKMATHNATLIKSSLYSLTEAAKKEIEGPCAAIKASRIERFMQSFKQAANNIDKPIVNRILYMTGKPKSDYFNENEVILKMPIIRKNIR